MKTILFQGDSITDAGRDRNGDTIAGYGYATLVKARLGFENPGEYTFYNRGVSGDRVIDMYARIVKDVLNLKPDYMSILIGVNDVWHGIDWANGTGIERYQKVYDMFLSEVKAELKDIKIIILEPFVLCGSSTKNTEEQPDRFERFKTEVAEMAKAARKIAEKHNLPFVSLQDKFDDACKSAQPDYWLSDGVHPTPAGHELIAREWIKAFEKIK